MTVWTGTQRPFGVRGELAEAFRIPEDEVRVLMPDTGSAYGGKHTGEAAIEAARLAKAAKRPVKVTWTREEEFTWAYFRPAGVIEVTSGVQKDGTITAWEFHNYNSGCCGIRRTTKFPTSASSSTHRLLRCGRGRIARLASTANHFARESHMDELAHALNMDPLQFRLKNLKNERLRARVPGCRGANSAGRIERPSPAKASAWAAAMKSWETSPLSLRSTSTARPAS